jgi:DNA (cytosine-5)-methyltransferase 1
MNRIIPMDQRLERLREGGSPRVLDLFSGCGGISLGFEAAGFEIAGGLELDPEAVLSHARNFHANSPQWEAHATPRDILETSPSDVCRDWGLDRPDRAFDIVVGGPPCQAFTRVGRAKLRSIRGSTNAHEDDPRARLAERFLDWVREIRPLAIMIENVPDMLNFKGRNVAEDICNELSEMRPYGYDARYTLLNAAFFGVPQARERSFILAFREDLQITPEIPAPTNYVDLPSGYLSSRRVALKLVDTLLSRFYEAPVYDPKLPRSISSEEAIRDLPALIDHLDLDKRLAPGASKQRQGIGYGETAPSAYALVMRNWQRCASNGQFHDHIARRLQRDYGTFREMAHGDEYPSAVKVSEERFQRHLEELEASGNRIRPGSEQFEIERTKFVPPYDVGKFPNKWWKLVPDMPSRTLTAHIGKDTYSHIHYDSEQARTITVREAARLQSFPDGFWFAGKMNANFRQIGNSVPPILVRCLAESLRQSLMNAIPANAAVRSG